MDIDLSSLLVFRHLADTGSFTEAGKRWKISQPAVTLIISRLESAAGQVLLDRSSSGTRLTTAGIQFLERTNEVCESYLTFIDGMGHISRRMDREVLIDIDRSWFGTILRKDFPQAGFPTGVTPIICETRENWAGALESSQYDVVIAGRFLRAGSTKVSSAEVPPTWFPRWIRTRSPSAARPARCSKSSTVAATRPARSSSRKAQRSDSLKSASREVTKSQKPARVQHVSVSLIIEAAFLGA